MLNIFRKTPLPSLQERSARLTARWSALDAEHDTVMDKIGQAVAAADGEDTDSIRELRARLNELRSQVEEVEAAQSVLDSAIAEAAASQTSHEHAQRDEAATEAAAGHHLAALGFDAAAVALAIAYGEYLEARREADSASRAAGWGPLPGRTALPVASALMHQAPDLCRSLRSQLGNTLFLRHGTTRPLAEFAARLGDRPAKETRNA